MKQLFIISFKYNIEEINIINNLSFSIDKGDIVGIIGESGVGKSTVVDLISGLLTPNEGIITIDDSILTEKNIASWQKQIAYVPQNIYLSDSTIQENIAFGIQKNQINNKKLINAAKDAMIHESIELMPEKYNTLTGERGINLSGGQKQRIAIARALYKDAKILILDEATNALDEYNEMSILNLLKNNNNLLTIIIISHNNSTLSRCNKIIKISKIKY
jgi:ATP-binding cassette subfamily B protein